MDQAVPVWGVLVGACVLCLVVAVVVGRLARAQRGLRAEVAALRRGSSSAPSEQMAPAVGEPAGGAAYLPELLDEPDFVITTAGIAPEEPYEPVPAGRFVSLAAGESLIRLVSLGHGVRRALSAENRSRIRLEMRREIRRSRKRRRREVKQVRRGLRSAGRRDAA